MNHHFDLFANITTTTPLGNMLIEDSLAVVDSCLVDGMIKLSSIELKFVKAFVRVCRVMNLYQAELSVRLRLSGERYDHCRKTVNDWIDQEEI